MASKNSVKVFSPGAHSSSLLSFADALAEPDEEAPLEGFGDGGGDLANGGAGGVVGRGIGDEGGSGAEAVDGPSLGDTRGDLEDGETGEPGGELVSMGVGGGVVGGGDEEPGTTTSSCRKGLSGIA